MTKQEVNKYLTEQMGECWHDWRILIDMRICKKCKRESSLTFHDNQDYYTAEGYDALLTWFNAWDEVDKIDFINYLLHNEKFTKMGDWVLLTHMVFNKENLATLMAEYLTLKEVE